MWTALREASQVRVTSLQQLQEASSLWAAMSCEEDLSGSDGCSCCPGEKALCSLRSGSLLHPEQAPYRGKGMPGKEGGKMREKEPLGSLPGAKDAAFPGAH